MLPFLFLVVCSSLGLCLARNESDILARVPDILQQLCPGANVCRENQSSPAFEEVFSPRFGSCCDECSCGTDCPNIGNCCFPHKLPTGQEDEDVLEFRQNGRSCVYPTTVEPTVENRALYMSYYMISSVPEKHLDDEKPVLNMSCGDEIVAPWGSLYPVYSTKHKQIYKNMACATADGVADGILWDAVLNCKTRQGIWSDVSNFVLWLDSNSVPDSCILSFIYPGNLDDIRSLKCYIGLIDTCPESAEFKIPEETGLSRENIITLCTSGIVSPYRQAFMYANVFCHICNGNFFKKESICEKDDKYKGPYTRGFIGLLDARFVANGRKKNIRREQVIPLACIAVNAGRCRPVFCPTGQLRDRTGKCTHPNKFWYNQDFAVFINLTSKEAINITGVFKIPLLGAFTYNLPAFKSPWSKNWFIDKLYHSIMDVSKNSTSFLVILRNKIARVQPWKIMQNINKTVTREWSLGHNNSTITLMSSMSSFATLGMNYADTVGKADTVFRNRSVKPMKPRYSLLYNSLTAGINLHLITKLYLCDQVKLNQSEFILSSDQKVLFNSITHRFMYDGEFALTSSFGGVLARICIEDSGMFNTDKGTLHNVSAFNEGCLHWFIAIALLCGIMYI